jgi:hypothetical protein
VPASTPQAVEVFSVGCLAGNSEACAEAGALLLAAAPGPPGAAAAPPAARADALLRAGCEKEPFDARSGRCCEQLAALHLSPRRAPGAPPPRAPDAQLAGWLRRGCDGEQPAACLRLALAHRFGALGLQKDAAAAEALEAKGLQWSGMSPEQAQKAVAAKAWGAR